MALAHLPTATVTITVVEMMKSLVLDHENKQERVALQERKESSFYKKLQASDNKYQITSNR